MTTTKRRSSPPDVQIRMEVEYLPMDSLRIDLDYQRETDSSRVARMNARFDPDLLMPLLVADMDDGTFAIIDGGHRFSLFQLRGYVTAPCKVVTADKARAAGLFVLAQTERRNVTPLQRFKANLVNGDPLSLMIARVLADFDLQIGYGGNVSAVKAVEAEAREGEDHLRRIFNILTSAWIGDEEAYSYYSISGLGMLLRCLAGQAVTDAEIIDTLKQKLPKQVQNSALTESKQMPGATHGRAPRRWAATVGHMYNLKYKRKLRYLEWLS